MNAKKGLLCFDLDNTLIRSDDAHNFSYNAALKEAGLKTWDPDKMKLIYGRPHFEVVRALLRGADGKLLQKVDRLHGAYLVKKYNKKARAIKGVISALKILKKSNRIAILSNCSHKTILCLLKGSGISRKLFDRVIGHDNVKMSKPYPDEILKAEKLMKHKEVYMIGDTIYDIMAGKRAKVKTISVLTGNQKRKQLESKKPDYIIKSAAELPKLLMQIHHKEK